MFSDRQNDRETDIKTNKRHVDQPTRTQADLQINRRHTVVSSRHTYRQRQAHDQTHIRINTNRKTERQIHVADKHACVRGYACPSIYMLVFVCFNFVFPSVYMYLSVYFLVYLSACLHIFRSSVYVGMFSSLFFCTCLPSCKYI